MKKNLNARKAQALKLNRETLRRLENGTLKAAGGVDPDFSAKFCTEIGCPTETCPQDTTAC